MTRFLQEAFAEAEKLPQEHQDRLAHLIKRFARDPSTISDDLYWELLLADPRSEQVLAKMAEEAQAEVDRGEVYDIETLCKE